MCGASFGQPFSTLQRSFDGLIIGPSQPRLATADLVEIADEELAASEVVAILRRGPLEQADALWRRLLAYVRAGQETWTVIAAGAMLPRLVTACSRFGRVPVGHIADVEAEMLTTLLEQMRSMDPSVSDVGSQLWRAAANAANRCGYRAQRDTWRLVAWERPGQTMPEQALRTRGPVTVLAQAVAAGVLTDTDAELIARTRLEPETLGQVATDLGLTYITARRWRHAAEARLALALGAQKFATAVSTKAA